MARTVTLAQLEDDVRVQADLIGATVRHTSAQVRRLINQSIQGFREAITNEGNTHFLVPYSGTLTAGATSPYSFGSLDLSAISPSIVRTYGLDVTVDGVVRTLDHRPFTERNIWAGPATTGIPRHWAHWQTAKLCIQPAPDAARPYTLWYLPVLADLAADGDTFDGVAGWEEWVVWDVVCKLLIRDQQSAAFASAKLYKDETWNRIHRQATRVSSAGGAVVGRDTLRGRIPDPLAARGPVMAGGSVPQAHSVTLAMLAEQTGPVFLGRQLSTTGDVQAMTPTEAASILPLFSPGAPGLVPASGGSATSLFLAQDGVFRAPAGGGGGGGSPGGPSGSIQFAGLSGFVGYTGFAVQGSPPSMTVRLPGSLRVTGGTVDVGSGTVRISASGIDLGGGQLANVSSLFAFPTFAAGVPGLVPASDGDASKFLNAAGGFAVPPGSAASPGGPLGSVQFQNSLGAFDGASGIKVAGSGAHSSEVEGLPGPGAALTFGDPATAGGGIGTIRSDGPFSIFSTTPSGTAIRLFSFQPTGSVQFSVTMTGALVFGGVNTTNRLGAVVNNVGTGGKFTWRIASVSGTPMSLTPSGLDFYGLAAFKSLSVADGIPNSQLATVPSGTVKGSFTNATPSDLPIPTLAAFFPTFTAARAGLVAPGDGDSSKYLNAAGTFSIPPGAGGSPTGVLNSQLADMPSGTVKARLTGTGAVQDVLIPSLFMYAPTMTAARAGIVGPGGGALTNFLRGDGAFAAPTGFTFTPTGLMNANLAPMPSGTVKANLSGTSVPSDLIIPTLMAFFPTFTAGRVGLVPATSDGDSSKFLNAAGGFSVPPGGAASPGGSIGELQFNNGVGGFGGASGLKALASGTALGVGATFAALGDLRGGMSFTAYALTWSGLDSRVWDWGGSTGSVLFGDNVAGLTRFRAGVGTGGRFEFAIGGATSTTARILPTGVDLTGFHVAMQGINVASGIPNTQLTQMLSGTVKANLAGLSTPSDVSIPTLMSFFPTFIAGRPGLVPGSADGDTGKFLNAAGAFSTPVAAATPGGDSGNVQWNNAGAMAGASGIHTVAGGAALAIGPAAQAANAGGVRVGSGFSLQGRNASGIAQPILEFWQQTGTVRFGSSGLARITNDVASGGVQQFTFGGATATTLSLLPTGIDAPNHHANFKSLNVGHINGMPFDFNGLKRGIDISTFAVGGTGNAIPSGVQLYLPRGAGSGANRFLIPSGIVGSGPPGQPFVTLNPTGGRGGGVIRIERLSAGGYPLEVRTPTGTVLHTFPSGTKSWADFMFEKSSAAASGGAVFQLAGHADMF